MTTKADIDPAVFDAETLAVVRHLLPPERVHAYLRDLDRDFRMVVDSASGDATLQGRAHKIVSQAGMLGLTRMSDCARQLEDACRAGGRQKAALRQCREAISDIQLYAMAAAGADAGDEPAPGI